MLIDWFTVGAQTLNFLILVWLMKRYLYKPILDAIDAREQRIAAELTDAAQKQILADQQREEFSKKNADFDLQRAALLRQATAEVEVERQRQLAQARASADAMQSQRHLALEGEMQVLQKDIARRSQEEVIAITRKVLGDLAGTTLEERMVEVLIQRLHALDANARAELTQALVGTNATARVRSAFPLTPAQQAAIGQAFNETGVVALPLQFETVPEVISGIELNANGWKIAWHIADYLASLEQSVGVLMQPDVGSEPNTP